ncbi:class I SAM-dependent RNA methyltransferase [Aliisedimentitalea scapharcae]|uniref:Class I SAM-dependent RNA methyltransferase n=1 Tax=Aliisedimentitalea scapharcae TaxID=1524259 RepID=A0ABZ2XZX6_9RHOB|nr:class I SAM-dependent RNA methyltransferase [Rhodobacteraceae bacterium M382]
MTQTDPFEIFFAVPPGLETALCDEARDKGFAAPQAVPGGVVTRGDWSEVWRANLVMRGASRVLVRIGSFRVFHLAQLDKRARKFPWADTLRPDVPLRVDVTCRRSKVYHAKAAAERIERALIEELGATIDPKAAMCLKIRIEDDLCTISIDTSGESLHKRGHKEAVGKAPMRETMAALFLRQAGYTGQEPVIDPMCGSGTFVLEAAEIAVGLNPGRSRAFAFEKLASFDRQVWDQMRDAAPLSPCEHRFYGSDRNPGAIEMSQANAGRAGVSQWTEFHHRAVSDLVRPEGPAGLVIANPPYGARIGNKKLLYALYGAFGQTLKERFSGWRAAIITSDTGLARATGLPFLPLEQPVAHGGLKVRLFQTPRLR